ncbi:EamA family transporter [Pontibacter toksunensis]|uniref:EamA family transporter n=1 Tax=Pontibacter toksunensis TaxID=1332631 RepID=A0ABW6BVQ1_9BACT
MNKTLMWITFALLAALTSAVVVTLSKAGIRHVNSSLAFAIQAVLILVVSWGVVAWQGNLTELASIEKKVWVYLVLAGIITCVSSLLSFYALSLADASRVSPLERLSLVFAIIFAVIFLREKVDWMVIAGATLMAIGAVLIAIGGQSSE